MLPRLYRDYRAAVGEGGEGASSGESPAGDGYQEAFEIGARLASIGWGVRVEGGAPGARPVFDAPAPGSSKHNEMKLLVEDVWRRQALAASVRWHLLSKATKTNDAFATATVSQLRNVAAQVDLGERAGRWVEDALAWTFSVTVSRSELLHHASVLDHVLGVGFGIALTTVNQPTRIDSDRPLRRLRSVCAAAKKLLDANIESEEGARVRFAKSLQSLKPIEAFLVVQVAQGKPIDAVNREEAQESAQRLIAHCARLVTDRDLDRLPVHVRQALSWLNYQRARLDADRVAAHIQHIAALGQGTPVPNSLAEVADPAFRGAICETLLPEIASSTDKELLARIAQMHDQPVAPERDVRWKSEVELRNRLLVEAQDVLASSESTKQRLPNLSARPVDPTVQRVLKEFMVLLGVSDSDFTDVASARKAMAKAKDKASG